MESLNVVGRHQRSGADVKLAAAGTQDFQTRILRSAWAVNFSGNFLYSGDSDWMVTVCESPAPEPHSRRTTI